jgi:hypothetical protein
VPEAVGRDLPFATYEREIRGDDIVHNRAAPRAQRAVAAHQALKLGANLEPDRTAMASPLIETTDHLPGNGRPSNSDKRTLPGLLTI